MSLPTVRVTVDGAVLSLPACKLLSPFRSPPAMRSRGCLLDLRPQRCGDLSDHNTQLPDAGILLLTPRMVTSCLQTAQNLLRGFRSCGRMLMGAAAADVRTSSVEFLRTPPFPAAGFSFPHVPSCAD